jgi:diguanylate cyclase (GGDEF)-like protein
MTHPSSPGGERAAEPARLRRELGEAWRLRAELAGELARRREEERLARLPADTLHDPLTGLPNRALLLDRVEVALKRAARREGLRFALLFIEIDRFKVVNDSLGHMLGDELLQAIAGRLRLRLRPGDTVARLGGDEFALLLDDLAEEAEAARLAEQIQEDLTGAFEIDGQEVFSSASIGIALGSAEYARAEDLLRDADTAMYRAKAQGRARYAVFQPDMHQRALSQLRMESALRRALERRELRLHYQPVIELAGGRIVGFEALLRWQHPELGLLAPEEFLGAAEETGVLAQFEGWVLREACAQGGAWRRRGRRAGDAGAAGDPDPSVGVYVNIQALQHSPRSLLAQVEEALAAAELPADCLHCELTERALMQDVEAGIEVLGELRARGVGVCLDDFGTGYSSLSYLLRFPVSVLKIDRSFMGSRDGGGHTALVESINSLAHTLDLAVIAEGIETPAQLATVRRLGCEYGQGFLFSPALDPAAAGELLAREPLWVSRHFGGKARP